ncbi:HAD family hydrolase, partial [Burkholderia gladioli]|nr:HAD family hydrolase [Burkholderia gladioli]
QMAASAGAAGVGVAYGAHSSESLATLEPRYIAADVEALAGWLREHA